MSFHSFPRIVSGCVAISLVLISVGCQSFQSVLTQPAAIQITATPAFAGVAGSGGSGGTAPTATYLHPYDENANAQQDINAALALAKADHKDVLLDFGGNWCPDCIVLAKYYQTEPLQTYVGTNYHIVAIDVGTFNKNLDLDQKYGDPIKQGVPAVVILDSNGNMVGSTGDGSLENASAMSLPQVMQILQKWPAVHS